MDATTSVDFGRRTLVRRSRGGRTSSRVDARVAVVLVLVVIATLAVCLATLSIGTFQVSLPDVIGALFGIGDPQVHTIVVEWRLPRLLFAVFAGMALAVSGGMFQSITRNPLGSPDIIGFDAGAYSGALVVMLVVGSGSYVAVAAGSVVGGLITAAVVYLLAYRGGVQGFRLIIIGIGVSALLVALNSYLLLLVDTNRAMSATAWGSGSLNALGFSQFVPFVLVLLVLMPIAFALAPRLEQGELGDDASSALGAAPERTRLLASITAVALAALVTAATGPITFIALVAPQIAKRLTRSPGLGLPAAAAVGALLLSSADFVAQRLALPVGVVTISVGGIYLIWLLIREYRRA